MHKEYIVGWQKMPDGPLQMYGRPSVFATYEGAQHYGYLCQRVWGGAFVVFERVAVVGPSGSSVRDRTGESG